MKNGFQKYFKGMFAIFTIKLVLVCTIFVYQSCQTNDHNLELDAKNNFLIALQESEEKIKNISVKRIDNFDIQARDLTDGTLVIDENITRLCVDQPIDSTSSGNSNTLSLGDVISLDLNFIDNNDYDVNTDGEYCYEVDEQEAQDALNPSLIQAKNYFHSNGFNDNDIQEILQGKEEAYLIPAAQILIQLENSNNNNTVFNKSIFDNLISFDSVYAFQNGDDSGWTTEEVVACMGVALGLNELWGLIDNTAQLATVQGTKKLIKLLAKRYLGWMGVAVAVYSFGDCMEVW